MRKYAQGLRTSYAKPPRLCSSPAVRSLRSLTAESLELEPFGSLHHKAFGTLFMISHRRVSSE